MYVSQLLILIVLREHKRNRRKRHLVTAVIPSMIGSNTFRTWKEIACNFDEVLSRLFGRRKKNVSVMMAYKIKL